MRMYLARALTRGTMALRLVVKKCTTAKKSTTPPAAMTAYAPGTPKPLSAAVEKPMMVSAAPTMMSALEALSARKSKDVSWQLVLTGPKSRMYAAPLRTSCALSGSA